MDKHQSVGGPYQVRGFPTVKVFGADKQTPADYQGKLELTDYERKSETTLGFRT